MIIGEALHNVSLLCFICSYHKFESITLCMSHLKDSRTMNPTRTTMRHILVLRVIPHDYKNDIVNFNVFFISISKVIYFNVRSDTRDKLKIQHSSV